MARITVNTTGTQPHLYVSTNTANVEANALSVTCLQDITVTNSTGIFSWTDFLFYRHQQGKLLQQITKSLPTS